MKEFTIGSGDDGRKLDRWLIKSMPRVTMGQRQKYFRKNCYKVNGHHARPETVLASGDTVTIYLPDELFEPVQREDPFLSKIHPRLTILYEDDQILLVDKQPGLMCHPDATEKVNTLVTHVQAYLYQKGSYDPSDKASFAPVLCNRIDRFTGGIVMIAKTEAAMQVLNQKIRDREIGKYYLCIALGHFNRPTGRFDNYIVKPPDAKKVSVSYRPCEFGQQAVTDFRVLSVNKKLNLVECRLHTGRTHQIRAQMAASGHPLLGDNQYGDIRRNTEIGRSYQALYAWKLSFDFETDAGVLEPLRGRSFQVDDVRFVQEYFPEYEL